MSIHPLGQTVEIFGIDSPTNGRSCEEHRICGHVLQEDVVVRFRKVQVLIKEKEESATAAFWVSDGIDRCRVGYLPRHHVKHWKRLEGCLAQIIEVYGEDADSPTKRQKHHRNSGVAVAPNFWSISCPTGNTIGSIQETQVPNTGGIQRRKRREVTT